MDRVVCTSTPSTTTQAAPDTRTMGAGPSTMDTGRVERTDNDRDIGWLGLLGLAGLLGLRRKKNDHVVHHTTDHRTTGNVR